ncbi:thymidylate kinase [Candidatus Blochmanniella floridana]|uniref:Thymidylate kinase n=1 Tax=Blochmanniella floridana TaxID=203907 RepID=KTHY_BLOFL|nr:RecName: Full=Thymidylate kinase; AltName: Full=dTMP kinase [Candidatus Blochmannia floridanus]CAD83467.1 thymidylate kinase [Candidatus Blochmannia floridanus]
MNNRFIVVEGLDGSGKTTIVHKIVKYFYNQKITNVITTHEPGGTEIAYILSELIKNKSKNEKLTDLSELLMLYAARSQLLENVIKPALFKGDWVIGDRCDLSSFAYQGAGRKLNSVLLNMLSQYVINDFFPKLIFYLDIPSELVLSRIKNRKVLDRIEQESLSFFNRVRSYYRKLAFLKENIIMIDASQPLEQVCVFIYRYLDQWLCDLYK